MAFNKKVWKSRISEYPSRRTLTDTTSGTQQVVTVQRNEGNISEQGDGFTKANMDDLENRIEAGFKAEHKFLTGVLNAGAQQIKFTDSSITSDCMPHIMVPIEKSKMVPNSIAFIAPHSLQITFPAQNTATTIKVKIEYEEV